MKHPLIVLLWVLLFVPAQGRAGTECRDIEVPPAKVMAAAETAMRVVAALDEADAPVALVARVGTDLSKHGLVYSHAGFAVRDHAHGRWTVVHLLNDCGSASSGLYAQGMVNFFADDLVNQDARIVWLQPGVAQRLAQRLNTSANGLLHHPQYNLIARPGSRDYQNSTAWILEMLASAIPASHTPSNRRDAYAFAQRDGFRADTIHIAYSKRVLGGIFAANTIFTDHPVATRLTGDYPVVTVRSIFRYLGTSGHALRQQEWRNGRLQRSPGPA
ncbi:DUF2145 domain-containing protein [Pseudoxanthomonas wuyuanensis]